MKTIILAGACLLLASSALAQSVGEKTGINSTLGITPKTADFVQEAAVGDMFEIASSRMAAEKLSGADKDFANQMVADHTKTSGELTVDAKQANIPLPTEMDSSHQSMLNKLGGLNSDDFRKQYFDDQVSAHKDAVSLFERYGKGGNNDLLKNWANTTLPTLQHHLEMAQGLDK